MKEGITEPKSAASTFSKKLKSMRRFNKSIEYLVIKELQTDAIPRRDALQAMSEIDIHGQLIDNPYTVQYIDSFIFGTRVNIVMEFCQNGDLFGLLKTKRQANWYLPEAQIL